MRSRRATSRSRSVRPLGIGHARAADLWRDWPSARRAARRRAAQGFGLEPGDRVAIVAKNSPDYVEAALRASGTRASPPCRPTPSCTAPSSATSSNIPARGSALPRDGLDGEIAPHAPTVARAADRHRQRRIRSAVRRRSDRGRAARRRRSRLAVLHLRHHRPAEGRDADPSRAGRREPRLLCARSIRSRPAIRSCMPRR